MAIKATLPADGSYTISDLFGILDYVTTEAQITGATSSDIFSTGTYNGESINFTISGSGFTQGQIGGVIYVTSGTLQSAVLSSASGNTVTFDTLDIDMAVFSPLIASDETGAAPMAIENFLMGKSWDVRLGNMDDIAPRGTLVGDGAELNLRGDDIIRGKGGNDNLYSGDGADKLFGDNGKDILDGGKGNDVVKGGKGNDRLFGSEGRDKLFGEDGKDVLKGGGGKDVLDGGTGNDVLTGGAGFDRFVFEDGGGRDKVNGFNANSNKEDIDLRAVSAITGFNDLKNHHMNQVGADVVIDDLAGTEIVLVGVTLADLGKGDFLF